MVDNEVLVRAGVKFLGGKLFCTFFLPIKLFALPCIPTRLSFCCKLKRSSGKEHYDGSIIRAAN